MYQNSYLYNFYLFLYLGRYLLYLLFFRLDCGENFFFLPTPKVLEFWAKFLLVAAISDFVYTRVEAFFGSKCIREEDKRRRVSFGT
ncbi:hypothetical protein CICLE_v10030441mg [Citrus x clementina]|uniref:Uncharacterized protein n=2 Tax=Citrus TaxID=2706 RepID=A0A067ESE0_CITSI|nr:hypothetical protein CICLE_v10030441mg [Citrus x clementina]KDO58089.1 hypothetical protein CISIN_1g045182mg [Citrus sinensis]